MLFIMYRCGRFLDLHRIHNVILVRRTLVGVEAEDMVSEGKPKRK
jgi:hypothetical protein